LARQRFDKTSENLPSQFRFGLSVLALDFESVRAIINYDYGIRSDKHRDIAIGGEVHYKEKYFIRAGLSNRSPTDVRFGFGGRIGSIGIHWAMRFHEIAMLHTLTVNLNFGPFAGHEYAP